MNEITSRDTINNINNHKFNIKGICLCLSHFVFTLQRCNKYGFMGIDGRGNT